MLRRAWVVWNPKRRRCRGRRSAAKRAGIRAHEVLPQADLVIERSGSDAPAVQGLRSPVAVDLLELRERLEANAALF